MKTWIRNLILLIIVLAGLAGTETWYAESGSAGTDTGTEISAEVIMDIASRSEAGMKKKKGWHKVKDAGKTRYYYVGADGTIARGWLTIGSKTYYCKKRTGYRVTGLKKIAGYRYFFDEKGVRQTGWQTIRGKRYYFHKKTGKAFTGLKKKGRHLYYFSSSGVMQTGWLTYDEHTRYYFDEKGRAATGLTEIDGDQYYFTSEGKMKTKLVQIGDSLYYFRKDGRMLKSGFTPGKRYAHSDGKILMQASLKKLLKTALEPVGHTLYVWGGGWGTADGVASGIDAVTLGVPAAWKAFFDRYGSGYDYRTTRFQTRNGLDCSGFVGWTLYNTFQASDGNAGFVMLAENMARTYASYGWGSYTPAGTFTDFRPGDIMSLASGHVYIVLGQCSDGSVVLLHASPPGVMISGTSTRSGNQYSQACALASRYMKKYFPEYFAKFGSRLNRGTSYLTNYARMRWYLSGNKLMSDPDGFAGMDAARVLKKLLGNA